MTALVGIMLTTYLAAVADTALAPAVALWRVTPCLLPLVAIVWMVSAGGSPWRIAQVAGIGLVFDFNSGGHAGVGVIAFALVGYAVLCARGALRRLGPLEQAVLCAPAVAAVLLLVAVGNLAFRQAVDAPTVALGRAAATAAYTAAVSLPVWMVLDWLRDGQRRRPAISQI